MNQDQVNRRLAHTMIPQCWYTVVRHASLEWSGRTAPLYIRSPFNSSIGHHIKPMITTHSPHLQKAAESLQGICSPRSMGASALSISMGQEQHMSLHKNCAHPGNPVFTLFAIGASGVLLFLRDEKTGHGLLLMVMGLKPSFISSYHRWIYCTNVWQSIKCTCWLMLILNICVF